MEEYKLEAAQCFREANILLILLLIVSPGFLHNSGSIRSSAGSFVFLHVFQSLRTCLVAGLTRGFPHALWI